jgi:hypothetical protein
MTIEQPTAVCFCTAISAMAKDIICICGAYVFDGELSLTDLERAVIRDLRDSGRDVDLLFYRHLLLETDPRHNRQQAGR